MMARLAIAFTCFALPALAQSPDIGAIVDGHILPGYRTLSTETQDLAETAQTDCRPDSPALRAAYAEAFDAWVRVSHLRFGPSETGDRAFALAFWPDSRGTTPKALIALVRGNDPVVGTLATFRTVSIAARGFYAMEFLLYDPGFADMGTADYRCTLIRVMAADIAANAAAILTDWQSGYGDLMRGAGGNDTYRDRDEAVRQLFTALAIGLEFTADTRLGRPMGSFERPRPNRAEARRSGRSLRHVVLSLQATRDLAARLSGDDAQIDTAFAGALDRAATLDDPAFAGVADPQGRLRVEVLQQAVRATRDIIAAELGPRLGIAAGFNSLDGD